MNSKQKAADKLGDMMKMLAFGCHVRVSNFVFKLCETSEYDATVWQWVNDYPGGTWIRSGKSVDSWISDFRTNNIEVVYVPPIAKKPTKKQVRTIEL